MKKAYGTIIGLLALICLIGVMEVGAQQHQTYHPVGSISFESTSMAAGVGISWDNGALIFQGKKYPISIEGLGIGAVGISQVNAKGNVYNLNKPSDVAGTYIAVTGGIAIVDGIKGTLAQNEKGVVIDLTATQEGVNFDLGAEGFKIKLK